MKKDFYHQFEMHHRGPREVIKQRISAYLPYVDKARNLAENIQVLDLGCGRGEWLELMQEHKIAALGIDINITMLDQCRSCGMKVEYCDAVKFLRSVPSSTYAVITAFHLVEHMPFEQLQELVQHARRVLLPGGLLILETPNPENITVATNTFYLDPTHQRPLPPLLLSFLPEHYGFYRSRIMRMQESVKVLNKPITTLHDVLNGASPDYAVVAQSPAEPELVSLFDELFSTSFGVDTDTLAHRFDGHISQVEQLSKNNSDKARHLEEKAQNSEKEIEQIVYKLDHSEQEISSLKHGMVEMQHQLNAIYLRRSWKLTWPLRYAGRVGRMIYAGIKAWLTFAPKSRPHRVACAGTARLKSELASRPRLKQTILKALRHLPWLKCYVDKLNQLSVPQFYLNTPDADAKASQGSMSPRACQIFSEIKSAVEKRAGEQKECE